MKEFRDEVANLRRKDELNRLDSLGESLWSKIEHLVKE
jgi:hypothetical protein